MALETKVPLLIWGHVTFILGLSGNMFVLYATVAHNAIKLDKTSIWIIKNLAVADLCNCLFVVVLNIAKLHADGEWRLGSEICYLHAISRHSFLVANMVLVNLLSLNKLQRCIYPLRNLHSSKVQKVVITMFTLIVSFIPVVWTIVGLQKGIMALIEKRTERALNVCKAAPQEIKALQIGRLMILTVFSAFPCLLLVVTTTALMVYALRKTNRPINKWNILIVVIVTVTFLVSFVPFFLYELVGFVISNKSDKVYLRANFEWVKSLVYLSTWSNPFIYLAMNKTFRDLVKQRLCLRKSKSSHEPFQLSTTQRLQR